VLLKVANDLIWFLPLCLVVFVIVETFAVWGILEEVGLAEIIVGFVDKAHSSLQKVVSMVPSHKKND
jgi:hypothetical protein